MSIVSGNIGQLEKKMTNKLQAVREAVISAVPSILELEFGCEVEDGTGVWKVIRDNGDVVDAWNGTQICSLNKLEFKVLGRPIRLADVLAAIHRKCGNGSFYVDAAGNFWRTGGFSEEPLMPHGVLWDLLHDDLNEQAPETISFLYEILCTGK